MFNHFRHLFGPRQSAPEAAKPGKPNIFIQPDGNLPMAENSADVYDRMSRATARTTAKYNKASLVQFHRALTLMDEDNGLSAKLRASDTVPKDLAAAETLLNEKMMEFGRTFKTIGKSDRADAMGRFSVALFSIERAGAIHKAALDRNHLGLYTLVESLTNDITRVFGAEFYTKAPAEVFKAYWVVEPMLIAGSEVCSLEMPATVSKIIDVYGDKVIEFASRYL